jgi:heptosyltransferase-2
LFITLQKNYPDVEIDVLAPPWSLPLLKRMPQITNTIEMPVGHGQLGLGVRYQLGKQLRARQYDQAIVIPRSWKSALIPFFVRIQKRTGYRGEMRYGLLNDIRSLDKDLLAKTVERYVNLGSDNDGFYNSKHAPDTSYPVLEVDQENQKILLDKLNLSLDIPAIGFMPGAEYGEAKRWPPSYFAALAQKLMEDGYQIWIFGSEKDRPVAKEITSKVATNGIVDLSGQTRLEDVIDLIALCNKVVTNDSGLMHIAAAVGTEMVAIYGSSTPDYTPPLSDQAKVMYLRLECSPCFKRECPYGHYKCLMNITVDHVFSACEKAGDMNT